jgi:hypothetical protein
MKLITEQRVQDEKLDWARPVQDGDKLAYVPAEWDGDDFKIVDAGGVVYDAILLANGIVDSGWTKYDSADTFERICRYKGGAIQHWVEVTEMWEGRHHFSLYQDKQTGELFSHRYHRQVAPSDFVEAVNTIPHLASWLLDLHEQHTVVFPHTGHIAVSLPVELRDQIERLAHLENRTRRDWIIDRLSEAVRDERSVASLAKEEEREKRHAQFIEGMRSRHPDPQDIERIIE